MGLPEVYCVFQVAVMSASIVERLKQLVLGDLNLNGGGVPIHAKQQPLPVAHQSPTFR